MSSVSYRIDGHSLLSGAEKEFASTVRSPANEAERELIQVILEMLMANRSLIWRYWTDWILRWLSWIERSPKKLSTDLPLGA